MISCIGCWAAKHCACFSYIVPAFQASTSVQKATLNCNLQRRVLGHIANTMLQGLTHLQGAVDVDRTRQLLESCTCERWPVLSGGLKFLAAETVSYSFTQITSCEIHIGGASGFPETL